MNHILPATCIAVACSLAPVTALAAYHDYLDTSKRHLILLGANWQKADAELRATRDKFPENSIELDDLGVGDNYTSWMVEYRYRFNERWAVFAGAFTFDVDGDIAARKNFNFDGVEFEAGAALHSRLGIDTYILDVMYTAYRAERTELLVGLGLHAFDLNAEIDARVFAGDREASISSAASELLAPLPNLRLQGFYALTPKLGAAATLGWLGASYDDYDGDFIYFNPRLYYRFGSGFGISAGYQWTDADLSYRRSSGEDEYNLSFRGVTLSLSYAF